jgi:hypothetical protein
MSPVPTAPGVYVDIAAAAPSASAAPSTGTWFVTGEAAQGPVGVAIPITSMTDYANFLGGRSGYTMLYDSLDEYFHDGGVLAYVSRIVGPSPVNATLVLVDKAATPLSTLTVTANGGGVWGNSCTVAVAAGTPANSYVITIASPATSQKWVSPTLFTPADAVTWASNLGGNTPWAFPFTIVNDGSVTVAPNNNPAVVTATPLASGADDLADVIETQWTTALTAFLDNLGPGQVSAPGHTTALGWAALIAHAGALDSASGSLLNNRFALCDDVDSATASSIVTSVGTIASGDGSYGMFLAPWVVIPGIVATSTTASPAASTRTVPPSALVAALIASSDQHNNAGVPAAGNNGISNYAIDVTWDYIESDRGLLNSAGVSVICNMNGLVKLYGYVSISTDPRWVPASFGRMRMSIVNQLNAAAAPFAFQQIDGQGHLLSAFNGALAGVCQDLWQQGALYGDTAELAFSVNTGPQVNTPTTLAACQLLATVNVRFSPYAEFTLIKVVQYSVAQNIPV